jgi:hypothetical protein
VRRGLKVAAWAAAFLAAAGIGAVVAAHSNPFPPGVEDPGVRSSASTPTATSTAAPSQSWVLGLRSETSHELFVGGRCTTRWRGRLVLTVDPLDHLQGSGQARLVGSLACDFPNAQLQVRTIHLDLQGQRYGARFVFRLAERGRVPARARDYGGFTNTLLERPLSVSVQEAATRTLSRADDTGRGRFVSSTRFWLRCSAVCV